MQANAGRFRHSVCMLPLGECYVMRRLRLAKPAMPPHTWGHDLITLAPPRPSKETP